MILCEVCGIRADMMDASKEPYRYYCSYHWFHRDDKEEEKEIELPQSRLDILNYD